MSAQWDTGYLITLGVCIVVGVAAVGAAGVGFWRARWHDSDLGVPAVLIGVIVLAICLGVGLYTATPFSGQYHRFQPLGGVVTKVGPRFLASDTQGGGSTQKYVLTFRSGLSIGCLDTRCANVEPGDDVTLMCERVFQFNAPSQGWDCNWGIDRKPDGSVIP
jgi:hypothetical protein